jgi:signal transduction histidine kinase
LIDNAFKFSASGDPVHVTCRRQDNRFVITVQDRGCGIAADRLPYLGAAGWQARAAHDRQGVGLGLILVRRLAEIHGGKLTITSQLRVGATAQIQLPLAGQGANG